MDAFRIRSAEHSLSCVSPLVHENVEVQVVDEESAIRFIRQTGFLLILYGLNSRVMKLTKDEILSLTPIEQKYAEIFRRAKRDEIREEHTMEEINTAVIQFVQFLADNPAEYAIPLRR